MGEVDGSTTRFERSLLGQRLSVVRGDTGFGIGHGPRQIKERIHRSPRGRHSRNLSAGP
jgi:hypothetical protein